MSVISKIIGILMVKHGMAGRTTLFHHLLLNIVLALALTVILSIMAGALFFGILFFIYCGLLSSGINQIYSALIIAAVFFLIMALLIRQLCCFNKDVKNTLHQITFIQTPLSGKATDLCRAFVSGLLKTPVEKL